MGLGAQVNAKFHRTGSLRFHYREPQMAPTSQDDDGPAQGRWKHPARAALSACFLAFACVAATWWLGLLAEGPARVAGCLCIVGEIGFLHVRLQPQIPTVRSLAARIGGTWGCLDRSCAAPLGAASSVQRGAAALPSRCPAAWRSSAEPESDEAPIVRGLTPADGAGASRSPADRLGRSVAPSPRRNPGRRSAARAADRRR